MSNVCLKLSVEIYYTVILLVMVNVAETKLFVALEIANVV